MALNSVPQDYRCAVICPKPNVNLVRACARFPSLSASVEPLVAARTTRGRGETIYLNSAPEALQAHAKIP